MALCSTHLPPPQLPWFTSDKILAEEMNILYMSLSSKWHLYWYYFLIADRVVGL